MKKTNISVTMLRIAGAAALMALGSTPVANAQEIETPKTVQHVFGTVGMPRGFTARLVVANLGAVVPDAPECEANLQFVGVTASRTGAETKAILKSGEKAVLEINAEKLIPERAPFNARVELGAIVSISARGVIDPNVLIDPNVCPSSLQIVNNATGITTNAVVQIGTFELPAVQ